MADEFCFLVVDARRPVNVIQEDLRRQVRAFLSAPDIAVESAAPEATKP